MIVLRNLGRVRTLFLVPAATLSGLSRRVETHDVLHATLLADISLSRATTVSWGVVSRTLSCASSTRLLRTRHYATYTRQEIGIRDPRCVPASPYLLKAGLRIRCVVRVEGTTVVCQRMQENAPLSLGETKFRR